MERSDRIPSFDGSPEKLATYRDEALAYTFTLEIHKRYLAGPRLAQNLTGVARTVIRRKLSVDPQWLAHPRGAYVLIDFLEQAIEQPTLVQASQYIQKFFYQLRRKRGETMTQWVNRHAESLWEASRALKRVQNEYVGGTHRTPASDSSTTGSYGWSRAPQGELSRWSTVWSEGQIDNDLFDEHGRIREGEDDDEIAEQRSHAHWSDWGWRSKDWSHQDWSSWKSEEYQPPQSWETDVPDFLPDYLVGFLLLQRSGLDALERANVLAAIRGVFSVRSVERALKEQWGDEDLMKRDRAKQQSFVAVGEEDDEESFLAEGDTPDFGDDTVSHEAYMVEQEVIDTALAAIHEQKRTLKEARWRQSQVRMGRRFYTPGSYPGGSKGSSKGGYGKSKTSAAKCLKCGGPHSSENCPVKKPMNQVAEEQAEVAFSAFSIDKSDEPQFEHTAPGTEHALSAQSEDWGTPQMIKEGKAVIDCGATSTLGSVEALEAIMKQNLEKCGRDRVSVDPEVRPTFKFGNNGTKSCLSTISLGVDLGQKSGQLQVHVHDIVNQPVLVSVKALKALGAVVDFERGEIIYRKACPKSVVPLETAKNGHLLMPLGGDLLAGAQIRRTPFTSLISE